MLAAHGLTEQQWRVLRALDAADEPLDAGTIADITFLLGPSLSRILAYLEERAFIERSPDLADQRRSLIRLTSAGRSTVRRIAPESETGYAAIEEHFGAQRLANLLGELAALATFTTEDKQ